MDHPIAAIAAAYLNCRDKIDEKKAEHKLEIAKLEDPLTKLENALLKYLLDNGLQNIGVPNVGTVFKKTLSSFKVADRDSYFEFVKAGDHWDFLEARANKTAVQAWLDDKKDLPPGISANSVTTAHVQRAS